MSYRKKDGSIVSEEWMDRVSTRTEEGDSPGTIVAVTAHTDELPTQRQPCSTFVAETLRPQNAKSS